MWRGLRADWKNIPSFLPPPSADSWKNGGFCCDVRFWHQCQCFLTASICPIREPTLTNMSSSRLGSHLNFIPQPIIITQEPDICVCGCQHGGCVPQRQYANPKNDPISDSERGALITFSVNGKCGYSVRSALEKRYAGLDGRDDHMFVGFRTAIAVRFEVREKQKRHALSLNSVIWALTVVLV